jgi:hypothetical protein
MFIVKDKRSPDWPVNTTGEVTLPTVIANPALAILLKTATIKDSIPAKLPWLSKAGTVHTIFKLAIGASGNWLLVLLAGTK